MSGRADLADRLADALALHEAGQLALAEAGYRAVLDEDPDEPDALNLLGVMLQERGEIDQAIALLTRALEVDPDFPEALANLSRARLVSGDSTAAADLARRAIMLDPDLAEAHLNLGRALLEQENPAGASVALRRAAKLLPGSTDILSLLGNALIRLDDAEAIAETLTEALALAPDRVDIMINLGVAKAQLDRREEALAWHEKAVAQAPENAEAVAALALTRRLNQDLDGSIAACRRALQLAPKRVDTWLVLGTSLAALGRFAEAEDCYHQALTLRPDSAEARRDLTGIRRQAAGEEEIHLLLARLRDAAAPRRERISAGMAAGALLDRDGAYDAAFAAIDAANRLQRALWRDAGKAHDAAAEARYVDWAISTFTPALFAATADWGDPSELPVFIVGMPRSGTSLVEQIAASHGQVFGAGERRELSDIVRSLNGGDRHRPPATWGQAAVRDAATAHLARMRGLGGEAARVIDKMPDNCRILGQIAVLFPRARVILCRRDPRDVCLSCHFQQFADGLAWSTDLAEMAERVRTIERLIAHWRSVLPSRVLEIQYETLIASFEAESRRLVDFLGLPWDPACLAFHATERPVLTASQWQVRQPLYSGSVGRWRHYRSHLGPLLEGLRGLTPDDDGSAVQRGSLAM